MHYWKNILSNLIYNKYIQYIKFSLHFINFFKTVTIKDIL